MIYFVNKFQISALILLFLSGNSAVTGTDNATEAKPSSESLTDLLKYYDEHGGFRSPCSESRRCRQKELECKDNICECIADHRPDDSTPRHCVPICYLEHQSCQNTDTIRCCYNDTIKLICDGGVCVDWNPPLVFRTAIEIILSVVMMLGVLALGTILWKMCTQPTPLRRRRRTSDEDELGTRGSRIRASLSSVQRAVTAMMRDRPPRYTQSSSPLPKPPSQPPCYTDRSSDQLQTGNPPTYEQTLLRIQMHRDVLPPPYDSHGHLPQEDVSIIVLTSEQRVEICDKASVEQHL